MKTSIQRQSQNKALLQNVDILKQLTETELLEMSDAMLEVAYENGDVVCRQGDMGSNFYIIKQGAVTCTQLDAQGNQLEVAHLMVYQFPRPVTLQFQLRFPGRLATTSEKLHFLRASLVKRLLLLQKILAL